MGRFYFLVVLCIFPYLASAQLRQNYYANICPNVENIVRNAVKLKFSQTFVTVPATLRLFFHDCMVEVRNFKLFRTNLLIRTIYYMQYGSIVW